MFLRLEISLGGGRKPEEWLQVIEMRIDGVDGLWSTLGGRITVQRPELREASAVGQAGVIQAADRVRWNARPPIPRPFRHQVNGSNCMGKNRPVAKGAQDARRASSSPKGA